LRPSLSPLSYMVMLAEQTLKSGHNPSQGESKMQRKGSTILSKKLYILTIGGGVAFWLANFAISRTPIAAEYRAALSIAYLPMLVESLVGGLVIGFCVSYLLLRFFDKIPTKTPILKSVILSLIVLIIVTILLQGPAISLTTSDDLRYFLIGTMFNFLRILALGVVIGYLYDKLNGGA
jgi:F0F1-type ATP synthase assembly protein I